MPGRAPPEFLRHLGDLLAPLGSIRARAMFSGHGLYCDGLFFAIVVDETLYLKADAISRPHFTARGLEPFRPSARRPTVLSYYPLPEAVLDEPEALLDWARLALDAARRVAARARP